MSLKASPRPMLILLNGASLLMFVVVLAVFAALSPRFLTGANLLNIVIQSAAVGIVATGMTFVLLTAGVDLSVGAAMFVGAAITGKWLLAGQPLWIALLPMIAAGLLFGAVNAFFITRLRIIPFVVTLATLFMGRGLALRLTKTEAMNLPEPILQLGATDVAGVPVPVLAFGVVALMAQLVLSRTPFGRQLYAIGQNAESARKAGIHVRRLTASVYWLSGLCAALGGIIALTQLGAVGPKFGENYEFKAIAAAVLGGTSLFGGRGRVFPGTVIGALLMQSLENGLVMLGADPYVFPLVTSAVIFVAVLVDVLRARIVERWSRRHIRPD